MKIQKALIWCCIVTIGLPIGYFGREYFHQPVDRVQSALDLFETYCLPFAEGRFLEPDEALVPLRSVEGYTWADPQSVMLLRYSRRECSVTDTLRALDARSAKEMDERVSVFVERVFSHLVRDPEGLIEAWPAFMVWQSHPRDDKRRRIVVYARWDFDEDAQMSLSFSYPNNDDVSENLRELRKGS